MTALDSGRAPRPGVLAIRRVTAGVYDISAGEESGPTPPFDLVVAEVPGAPSRWLALADVIVHVEVASVERARLWCAASLHAHPGAVLTIARTAPGWLIRTAEFQDLLLDRCACADGGRLVAVRAYRWYLALFR